MNTFFIKRTKIELTYKLQFRVTIYYLNLKMPSPTISTKYHAYYSKIQSEQRKFEHTEKDTRKIRYNVWLTKDGKEVFASDVSSEKKKKSDMNFPDMVYIGEVTKWVRNELW